MSADCHHLCAWRLSDMFNERLRWGSTWEQFVAWFQCCKCHGDRSGVCTICYITDGEYQFYFSKKETKHV